MTTEVGQSEQSADTDATAAARKQPAAKRTVLSAIGLALVFAIGISAYLLYALQQVKTDLAASLTKQQQQSGLTASVSAMRADSEQFSRELAGLRAAQETMLADLAAVRNQAMQNNFDWLLAEVEYLFIIASQRLALDQDVAVALAALQTAEHRLRDYNDPQLLPIKNQLNTDINALQSVTSVDISGLALYLIDIAARVEKLPLKPVAGTAPGDPESTTPAQTAGAEVSFWRRLGNGILNSLKDLVRIYHEDDAPPIALLPQQRYHVYQNLSLQLETATRSVLRRETHNFHAALTIIQNWLSENFDTHDPAVSNIIDSLNRMASIELNPQLPTIDSSLETLRALIRETTADPPAMDTPGAPAP